MASTVAMPAFTAVAREWVHDAPVKHVCSGNAAASTQCRAALMLPLRCPRARAPRSAPGSRQRLVQEQGSRIPRVALQLARRGRREASHPAEVWTFGRDLPAESGYHRLQALQQDDDLKAMLCCQPRHLGGGSGTHDRCAQLPLGLRW